MQAPIFEKLLNTGIHSNISFFENKRVRIVNLLTLYTIALHIIFALFFFLEKNIPILILHFTIIIFASFTFIINLTHKYTLAKIWLYCIVSFDIFLNALFNEKETFTQYYFFGVFLLAFIIFTQRKYHYLFSAITLINFILLQSLFNKFEPIIPFSIYFYYFDIIALFFILTSAMNFFLSEIEAQKQLILDKNTELLNQTKLLEQTDLIRTKLFSIISHDLRSPIAGFKSLLQLFEEQEISTEEFGDYIKQLKEQTGQLSATLDQLLHWSQIQLKGIQTNRTHFNLTKIIQEEYNLLAQNMLQKSIKYTFHSFSENCTVYADKDHIRIVIRNLIQNAIKFTSYGGSILVSIEEVNNTQIRISVKDTGLGIDPDKINTLLNSDRIESSRGTNNEQGVGLGLSLIKYFLEQNVSTLQIESEKGQGSTFSFLLNRDL